MAKCECGDQVDYACCAEAYAHPKLLGGQTNSELRGRAADPSERVHDAERQPAPLDGNDVVKRGPKVGIVDSFEKPKADHRSQNACGCQPSGDEEEGHAAKQARRLHSDADTLVARVSTHTRIGDSASANHSQRRCNLQIRGAIQPGLG